MSYLSGINCTIFELLKWLSIQQIYLKICKNKPNICFQSRTAYICSNQLNLPNQNESEFLHLSAALMSYINSVLVCTCAAMKPTSIHISKAPNTSEYIQFIQMEMVETTSSLEEEWLQEIISKSFASQHTPQNFSLTQTGKMLRYIRTHFLIIWKRQGP